MARFLLGENATVTVRAAGDVCIRGWEQTDMQALCGGGRLVHTQEENGVVYVVSKSDLCLMLPASAAVRVEHISGDAYLSGLAGRLEIQKVGGDLAVERCNHLNLAVVGGDLMLREIGGSVDIQRVSGDITGASLGDVVAEQIGGSATLQVFGDILKLRTGGDIEVSFPGQGHGEVNLRAGADIEMYTDGDLDARLDLRCGGRDISVELGGKSHQIEDDSYSVVFGEGKRLVSARAGSDIRISDDPWEGEDLQEEFDDLAEEWQEWVEDLDEDENRDSMEDLQERIQRRADEAARKAERRVREAMERVERKNRERQDIFSRFGIRWGNFWPSSGDGVKVDIKIPPIPPVPPVPPVPNMDFSNMNFGWSEEPKPAEGESQTAQTPQTPQTAQTPQTPQTPQTAQTAQTAQTESQVPPAESVTYEERMQVLRMLREHKITVEEADDLLRALGGG